MPSARPPAANSQTIGDDSSGSAKCDSFDGAIILRDLVGRCQVGTMHRPDGETMSRIAAMRARSLADPEGFWAEAAEAVEWYQHWDRVLDDERRPFTRWFPGAITNTCHNALDRHVAAGVGERIALLYESPVTGRSASFSYRELRDRVARFAGALAGLGVGRGDRVIV